jgi:DNA-3-methyladenine glycosylase
VANVSGQRMDRMFFARPTAEVAIELLGRTLCHETGDGVTCGKIVETEAYLDETDLASHAAWSRRGRETMDGPAGRIYMYRAYGIHDMFNIVAKNEGARGAVLIRALDPTEGSSIMRERRGVKSLANLSSGPGKLCQAMGFNLDLHGVDLTVSPVVWITAGPAPARIRVSQRVGITRSPELLLRFFDPSSPHVSATRLGSDLPIPVAVIE